jgi:hypothetical protein
MQTVEGALQSTWKMQIIRRYKQQQKIADTKVNLKAHKRLIRSAECIILPIQQDKTRAKRILISREIVNEQF